MFLPTSTDNDGPPFAPAFVAREAGHLRRTPSTPPVPASCRLGIHRNSAHHYQSIANSFCLVILFAALNLDPGPGTLDSVVRTWPLDPGKERPC